MLAEWDDFDTLPRNQRDDYRVAALQRREVALLQGERFGPIVFE